MNTSTEKGLPKRRACIPCNMVMKISWPGLLLQFLLADNDIRAWVTANSCWHLTGFKPLNLYPSTVPFYHLFLLFLACHGLNSAYLWILLSGWPGSWPTFCLFMYPFFWVTRVMAYILPIYESFCLGYPGHGLHSAYLCILLSGWPGSWPIFCQFMYPFVWVTREMAYILPIYVSFFVWVTRVMASWYGEKQWDNREAWYPLPYSSPR